MSAPAPVPGGINRAELVAIEAARARAAATTNLLAAMLQGRHPVWDRGPDLPPRWVHLPDDGTPAPDSLELLTEAQILAGIIGDDLAGSLMDEFLEIRGQAAAWQPTRR